MLGYFEAKGSRLRAALNPTYASYLSLVPNPKKTDYLLKTFPIFESGICIYIYPRYL
jgi:hypothetical protein